MPFADTALRTAEEIALAAYVDLASAYRNLETLEQLGIVRHVHLGHGPGLYARAGLAELEHAVCESCGAHRSVPAGDLQAARDAIYAATGITARFSHFPSSAAASPARRRGDRSRRYDPAPCTSAST